MSGLLALLLATAAALVAVTSPGPERRVYRLGVSGQPRSPRRDAAAPVRGEPAHLRRSVMRGRSRSRGHPQGDSWLLAPPARRLFGAAAGLGLYVVVGGVAGFLLGVLAAIGLPLLVARLPDPAVAVRLRLLHAELPLALDLMAACLAAGAPLPIAVGAVAAETSGPLAEVLRDVARQLQLGASPLVAWRGPGRFETLQPLVETVTRVGDSGAALVPALRRLAADERDRRRRESEIAVRRVGVFVVIPLGICFLPAFLLIGIVPIVAGLIGGLLP